MKKNLLHSKFFIVFLIVIFVLIIIAFCRESYRYFRINQEIKELEKKIEELEFSNKELAEMEKYFQSEDFLEKEARLKLNLTKPGEGVIIIKQSKELEQETQEEQLAKELSNIQKWWDYFFGRR